MNMFLYLLGGSVLLLIVMYILTPVTVPALAPATVTAIAWPWTLTNYSYWNNWFPWFYGGGSGSYSYGGHSNHGGHSNYNNYSNYKNDSN